MSLGALARSPAAGAPLTGLRPALDAAFGLLAKRVPAVRREWRRRLRALLPERDEFEALQGFDLASHYARLVLDPAAFEAATESEAQALARRGVAEEHAVAALGVSLEVCLSQLSPGLRSDEGGLALVRLSTTLQHFVVVGYRKGRLEGWQRIDDQERLRLSRDLHDEIGGDLVVLKLYVEIIAMDIARGNMLPVEAKLRECVALIGHGLESVRRLTLDLGPAILEQVGFLPALRVYARQFSERTGIEVEIEDVGLPEEALPQVHQTALYHVLQGALSNVAQHAQATRVRARLGCVNGVLLVVIEDDGAGFDTSLPRQSFGLTAMRDRVQALGGRLHVESRLAASGEQSGTRIEIDLPLTGGDA